MPTRLVPGLRRGMPRHVHAAEPVVEHTDLNALSGLLGEGVFELVADLVVGDYVVVEVDPLLGPCYGLRSPLLPHAPRFRYAPLLRWFVYAQQRAQAFEPFPPNRTGPLWGTATGGTTEMVFEAGAPLGEENPAMASGCGTNGGRELAVGPGMSRRSTRTPASLFAGASGRWPRGGARAIPQIAAGSVLQHAYSPLRPSPSRASERSTSASLRLRYAPAVGYERQGTRRNGRR